MKNLGIVLLVLAVFFQTSCIDQKAKAEVEVNLTEQEMVAYFNSFNAAWKKAIQEDDANYFIERYDEHAIIGSPGKDFIVGKKAITNYWNNVAKFLDDFSYETQKMGGDFNGILYENGVAYATYTIDNKQITDTSKYLFVWEHIGGKQYKVLSEMFNE